MYNRFLLEFANKTECKGLRETWALGYGPMKLLMIMGSFTAKFKTLTTFEQAV